MKALKILCVIFGILLIFECIVGFVFKCRFNLDYVECLNGREYLEEDGIAVAWDKAKCKAEVENMFGNPKYIYIEVDMDRSFCMPTLFLIGINKSLTDCNYIQDLTHELIHYTEFTGNERYTQFRTFQLLYESEIPELHEAGRRLAITEYFSCQHKDEYNCWYYIKEYLKSVSKTFKMTKTGV